MRRSPIRACHVCCQLEQWCRCSWWRKNRADVAICVVVASILAAAWLMTGCEDSKEQRCEWFVYQCARNTASSVEQCRAKGRELGECQ